jgi:hypothetical protein
VMMREVGIGTCIRNDAWLCIQVATRFPAEHIQRYAHYNTYLATSTTKVDMRASSAHHSTADLCSKFSTERSIGSATLP